MNKAAPKVAVIGGGPAGLMAAERLSALGYRVAVYEAKASFGRKFLLAGRGGLNLTHSEDLRSLLQRYGPAADFFRQKIARFSPQDLRAWCHGLGIETFVGSSGRVFPETFKASPLLRAWLTRLQEQGVHLKPNYRWRGFKLSHEKSAVTARPLIQNSFTDRSGATLQDDAEAVLLALGGASWPRMGSDGAWLPLLKQENIACDDFRPSNCGFDVLWSGHFAERHAGTALKNLGLKAAAQEVRGEIMIARYGLEGGGIYAIGRTLREQLNRDGAATLVLDLKPDSTRPQLAKKLSAQRTKDSLANKLRKAVNLPPAATALLRECARPEDLTSPDAIANAIKALPLKLTAAQPLERAISSVGGLKLENLNPELMLNALPGIFVAGEMLDWDAPTGGYLLQGTFATAICAADGVHHWLSNARTSQTSRN